MLYDEGAFACPQEAAPCFRIAACNRQPAVSCSLLHQDCPPGAVEGMPTAGLEVPSRQTSRQEKTFSNLWLKTTQSQLYIRACMLPDGGVTMQNCRGDADTGRVVLFTKHTEPDAIAKHHAAALQQECVGYEDKERTSRHSVRQAHGPNVPGHTRHTHPRASSRTMLQNSALSRVHPLLGSKPTSDWAVG